MMEPRVEGQMGMPLSLRIDQLCEVQGSFQEYLGTFIRIYTTQSVPGIYVVSLTDRKSECMYCSFSPRITVCKQLLVRCS